ncbi:hypothetical protein ZOSMA_120G00440 [Zostera marina]|uniref:YABBY N-terminal domain-containing protein n=1 Tax=Zostera marina TaxID=29655 RepID=A0A0K9Q0V8_ZOSMR|nr:hypothetical protein ZOSMA_120G00440 [Zostera marina]
MSSSSSSSAATFSLDHLTQSPSEQLCYVHCNFCDTVLAVSVPYTSLFKTVTVRCGHCSNLLSVNMRALHLPPPLPPPPPPSTITQHHQQQLLIHNHCNLLEEISYSPPPPPPLAPHPVTVTPTPAEKTTPLVNNQSNTVKESLTLNKRGEDHQQSSLQQPPAVNRRERDREYHLPTTGSSRKRSNASKLETQI